MGALGKILRYSFEYAAFRIVAAIFRTLPVETASSVSGWLWRKVASKLYRHKRALDNLAKAFPDKSLQDCEAIALDMWENLGRTFAEAFHLREIAESDRIAVENREETEQFARQTGGKLYCSGHFANWELIVAGMGQVGVRPVSTFQRVKNPYVDAYMLKQRRFLYTGALIPKNNSAARHLIRAGRNGGDVALLVDQRDFGGIKVSFFSRPAPTTPFPAILVQMLDLPVYFCTFSREKNVRFRLRIEPLQLARAEGKDADIAAITASIQGEIERAIRANPSQWMWAHRRWG